MAVTALPTPAVRAKPSSTEIVESGIRRRYAAERRFRLYGILAVMFGLTFLVILFTNIISKGYTSFLQSAFRLEVFLDPGGHRSVGHAGGEHAPDGRLQRARDRGARSRP